MIFSSRNLTQALKAAAMLCILAFTQHSLAATYYVDRSNGNDSNAGSANAPWASLVRAANGVSAGDTVYVRPGVYNGTNASFWGRPALTVNASGTSSNPIKFIADGDNVVYDGGGSRSGLIFYGKAHIEFDGFEIRNTSLIGVYTAENSQGIVVRNSHIHHVDGNFGENPGGIRFDDCTGCKAIGNRIHNITTDGQMHNGTAMDAAGIHSYDMQYTEIRNNIVYNTYHGIFHKRATGQKGADVTSNIFHDIISAVTYGQSAAGNPPHVGQTFVNNLVYNADNGIHMLSGEVASPNRDFVIRNNTFITRQQAARLEYFNNIQVTDNVFYHQSNSMAIGTFETRNNGLASNNNCFYGNYYLGWNLWGGSEFSSLGSWSNSTGQDSNSIATNSDPLNNVSGGDYGVNQSSACAGKGADLSWVGQEVGETPAPVSSPPSAISQINVQIL